MDAWVKGWVICMQQAGSWPWERSCPIDSLEVDLNFYSPPFQSFPPFLEQSFPWENEQCFMCHWSQLIVPLTLCINSLFFLPDFLPSPQLLFSRNLLRFWRHSGKQRELDFPTISLATVKLTCSGLPEFACYMFVPQKCTVADQLWWTTGLVHCFHCGRGSLGMGGCWIVSVCFSDHISCKPVLTLAVLSRPALESVAGMVMKTQ